MRRIAVLLLVWTGSAVCERAAAAPPPEPALTTAAAAADTLFGCDKYPANKRFKWTVRGEVGVSELAASLGQISCKPIIVPSAIASRGAKVVLEVPDLVTTADVYHLFYGALEAMGLTVETNGNTLKVVDAGHAREAASVALDGAVPADDRWVVRLYKPAHAAAAELGELLGKLKSKDGEVSPFGASLVLIDRAANVQRMETLARALDVGEAGARIYTLTTHGQTPTELAGALEKLLGATHRPAGDKPGATGAGAAGKGGAPVVALDGDVRALVPLDGARLLGVVGNDAGWARVQAIAARLDPEADDGAAAQGHVLPLSNTNAEDMATTLSSIGLGSSRGGAPSRPSGSAPSSAPAPSASALPLSGEVRIGADKTSNALVVFANANDFAMIRDLVAKLDVPRRQVYVEAVVLDLSVDKARSLGLSWHGAGNDSGSGATGFASNQSSGLVSFDATSIAAAASGGGLVAGVLGPAFQLFGQDVPSFGVILQALERTKDANVISRPHLLTMDNTKASLSVGQVIRYATQSLTNGATTGTTALFAQNYVPEDVALKLELTPHLNDSPSIRLEINGEISDVPDGQANQPGGPTIDKRTINTAVVVQDGQTVVLGGLTKETDSETVEKIPGLGDIPLIGRLFQTRSKQRVKQDLLIVLTPYIIRGPEDVRRIQERREEERREFLERYSAFSDGDFSAHVDYKRTRGLLEEINLTAVAAAREAQAVRAAERALKPRAADGVIALEPAE